MFSARLGSLQSSGKCLWGLWGEATAGPERHCGPKAERGCHHGVGSSPDALPCPGHEKPHCTSSRWGQAGEETQL